MSVDALLCRLEGVSPNGDGRWMAKCPAHEDKRASLSIRELQDGRTLVNCFGGCGAADVIGAIGLEFSALFPQRIADEGRQVPRHERPRAPYVAPQARLDDVCHEAVVAAVILSDLDAGEPLTPELADRFAVAAGEILKAAESLRERA